MTSLNAFSQNATPPTVLVDSTTIQLTKPIARLVIKDLVQFDGLTEQMTTMQKILTETNNKLLVQTDLVSNLEFQVINYQRQVANIEEQLRLEIELRQQFEKVLKREKRKATIYKVGSIVGATATLLLLAQ